jgi:hypothetical protein
VIRSSFGAFLDSAFLKAFLTQRDKIVPNDFYLSERMAFRKFPILREIINLNKLESFRARFFGAQMEVVVRTFYVDADGDFFLREDGVRYKQKKSVRQLTVPTFPAT